MNEKAQRIKGLFLQSGKSYQELEKLTGVKKSSLQRYASGTTTKIPMDVIEKIETAFNVPRGYIMGWDEKPAEELQDMGALAAQMLLEPDALEVMQKYMAMEETDRQAVRDFLALDAADRYALRLVMASMSGKQKKTDAGASVVEVAKSFDKA